MAEQIDIALSTKKVPLFRLFMAQPGQKEFVLVDEEPCRPRPGYDVPGEQLMLLTIQAQGAWEFFYLGAEWAQFEKEVHELGGGPAPGRAAEWARFEKEGGQQRG